MTYEELKNIVSKHCNLYYNESAPEISDAEFDKLYDQLEAVEKLQGWSSYDSPTIKVGGKAGKTTHPYKLYSLKKVYDKDEIDSTYDIVSPKIDGANLTLVYKYGKLKVALTRGNGELGDNIIHLAREITNIPKTTYSELDELVVNGECVTDNIGVENYRNYVSGALGLKSEQEFRLRNIKFIAHDVLSMNMNYKNKLSIIENMGFTTVLSSEASKYPTDGIVYRINDAKKCKELGHTAKHPRFAIALKTRETNTVTTVLQDVIWDIGRTGTVNPTAIVTPVVVDDANISRVTLHNIGIIEEHNLGLGDIIEIERAGGVIPKFLRVIEHSDHSIKINKQHAEKSISCDTYREGPKLYVKDKTKINNYKLVEYFVTSMAIKGLGPASIAKIGIGHPAEIYSDVDWTSLGVNGYKIIDEIEKSKLKPYEVVLASLGIPLVGKTTAKLIVKHISKFSKLRDINTLNIKGIGPAVIDSINDWLIDNEQWVEELPLQLEQTITIQDILSNKKVCITGKLDMTRGELSAALEKVSIGTTSTITKDCYALISGGDTSSSKYKKAIQSGIPVIDYWANKKEILLGNF